MRVFYLGLSFLLFSSSTLLLASGWVKEGGNYYIKCEHAQASSRRFEQPEFKFDQVERTTAFYGEYGLKIAKPVQLSLYSAFKSIKRTDPVVQDNFVAKGFADTDLTAKTQVGEWSLAKGNGGKIMLAAALGGSLPTTNKKRSAGHEADQAPEMPESRLFLISSVDRGRPAISAGLGTSYFYQFFWTNIGYLYKKGTNARWNQSQADIALGFSLPLNSWLQVSSSRLVSGDHSESGETVARSEKTTLSTQAVSLGLTFWKGMALEPRYEESTTTDRRWEPSKTFAVGLSVRT